MAEPCTSKMIVEPSIITKNEKDNSFLVSNLPIVKPRHKPLTSPIVTQNDLAKEIMERAEKRQKSYPDGVDVLLAMKQATSPAKTARRDDGKLDACELLNILQDGAEGHYVEKPKPPKVPRLSRGLYKDLKIDPELEKRLALQQLMEFSQKKGRPKKSDKGKTENVKVKTEKSDVENNNHNTNNNNEASGTSETKQSKKSTGSNEPKITPNRELRKLLQDEGAINMLYSIEKGETENKEKLLPSKRRMKKAFMKKAQEVTEALLGGNSSPGVSLRHRSLGEKRKLSTESIESNRDLDQEQEHDQDFQFTPPPDSRIIRRHSSSSSYSSRASSPRLSSPPPPVRPDDEIRISKKAEALIDAKCRELNLQPEHSKLIKKLIHDKQNGFKERLQSEFASKLRAAISRGEAQLASCPDTTSEQKTAIWKMVEEDWGSGGSDAEDDPQPNGNEPSVNISSAKISVITASTTCVSTTGTASSPTVTSTSTPISTATVSPTKTAAVVPSVKLNCKPIPPGMY